MNMVISNPEIPAPTPAGCACETKGREFVIPLPGKRHGRMAQGRTDRQALAQTWLYWKAPFLFRQPCAQAGGFPLLTKTPELNSLKRNLPLPRLVLGLPGRVPSCPRNRCPLLQRKKRREQAQRNPRHCRGRIARLPHHSERAQIAAFAS